MQQARKRAEMHTKFWYENLTEGDDSKTYFFPLHLELYVVMCVPAMEKVLTTIANKTYVKPLSKLHTTQLERPTSHGRTTILKSGI